MGSFTAFPTGLVGMLQTNFLEREMEEGLDSILAYRREAVRETVNARIGETLTRTRKGRKIPVQTALAAVYGYAGGLDNNLVSSMWSVEQYQFTMSSYADTIDVDLIEELAGIADQLIAASRNNGVQAAQSLERISRLKLFGAYLGGNTICRADLTASTTTTARVNDIRGFQNVLVNGQITPVSASNTLTVQEVATAAGGQNQTLTVTGVTADGTNASMNPDGISGTLTFNAATAPVTGDALLAVNAPKIFRPFSKLGTNNLNASDVFTLGLVEDVVAYLRDNAVPPMPDGTYHCILDNTSLRQLYADQDFKVLFAGREATTEYRDGDIIRLLGVTYIPTTEAYIQQPNTVWSTGAAVSAPGTAGVTVRVRRPIVMGAESIIQGDFEGLDIWLNRTGISPIGEVMLMNGVAQVIRPPLDRLQKTVSLTWTWIGDFAIPSDLTATTSIVPTASNALYKRIAVIETAG